MGIDNPLPLASAVLRPPTSDLFLWYHADQLVLADGTAINITHQWPPDPVSISNRILGESDFADNTNPLYRSNVGGYPAIQYLDRGALGTSNTWAFPNPFTSFTGAAGCEIFCIIKCDFDPPTDPTFAGLWTLSSGIDYDAIYRWPGADANFRKVFFAAFSTANHDCGIPTANLAAWQVLSVKSKTNLYNVRISGTDIFTTATNTFFTPGNSTGFRIGVDRNPVYPHGYIRELMFYQTCDATATRAAAVEAYANQKYGI